MSFQQWSDSWRVSFREVFRQELCRSSDYNAEGASGSSKPRVQSGTFPKKYFKKLAYFRRRKSVRQAPRFTTQFTTTSPRFTIKKHHKNAKTPCKTILHHKKHFFLTHATKTRPVRLDPCGSSSPSSSSSSLLPPWRRTRLQVATRATRSRRNPTSCWSQPPCRPSMGTSSTR